MGISIFGFKTYLEQVFNLMNINTTPTLTDLLQAETLNAEKKKTYYQRYDIKQLRAFHKQAIIKQQLYDNMLAIRSGMDYSAGILFQTSIINMKQAERLTKNNQQEKWNISGAVVAPSSTPELVQRIALWDLQCESPKKKALGMALSKSEAKKTVEDAILYYARAVGNKLLVGLSATGSQQASTTQGTNEAIDQILDYCATYTSDGILY